MQQQPKQEQTVDGSADQAKPEMTLKAIAETMTDPEFVAEQLPGLWQQITETGGAPLNSLRQNQWKRGIETMFRRCSTYPQHTKLTAAVFELPPVAWYDADRAAARGNDLLEKAEPAQIREALTWEQQRPDGRQRASNHIVTWATIEQLTGPVIERLGWQERYLDYATTAEQYQALKPGSTDPRIRHVVEHIQQELLGGNETAWTVFHGIIEPGDIIGGVAELANAIAQTNGTKQQQRPH